MAASFGGGFELASGNPEDFKVGLIACMVAAVGFGSNYLPVKKVDAGDGIFFATSMAVGIWLTGLVFDHTLASAEHRFEPFVMLGGALWCTGNLMTPLVIKHIGLGLGVTIWGIGNLVTGWATGNFGLFGVNAQPVPNPMLNYIGFTLCCLSLVFFAQAGEDPKPQALDSALLEKPEASGGSDWTKGFVMAVTTGVLFGSNFDPNTLLMQEGAAAPGSHSIDGKDYVFSHFTGILTMAMAVLAIYCVMMGEKRYTPVGVFGPAVLAGIMWGIAQSAWFVANDKLSLVVSFPLITTLPGVVSIIWGAALFGEFQSRRSRGFVLAALAVLAPGVSLIAMSKQG